MSTLRPKPHRSPFTLHARFEELATGWQVHDSICLVVTEKHLLKRNSKLAETISTISRSVIRMVPFLVETFPHPAPSGSCNTTEQGFSDNSAGLRALHEGFGCAATAPPEYELRGETSAKVYEFVRRCISGVARLAGNRFSGWTACLCQ